MQVTRQPPQEAWGVGTCGQNPGVALEARRANSRREKALIVLAEMRVNLVTGRRNMLGQQIRHIAVHQWKAF